MCTLMSWQDAVFLNDSEKIIEAWGGNWEVFLDTVASEDGLFGKKYVPVQAKGRSDGILVLTNHRLVWLAKEGFFIFASYHASFEIDLSTIRGISCGGIFDVWVSNAYSKEEARFHLQGVGKSNIGEFRNLIFKYVKLKKQLNQSAESKPEKVIVKEIVMLPCQYCRALMPQTALFCPHCGARRTG
jgi:hypothetical protein